MSPAAIPDIFQQQAANRRRTVWLVIGFILFFAWLGFGGDFILYLYTASGEHGYRHGLPVLGPALLIMGSLFAWWAYSSGPERVLWATGAREVRPEVPDERIRYEEGPSPEAIAKQRQLVNVVEEMAIAAGVPKPRIWIVPDSDPNAFATGLDPQGSHVAITQGLLDTLSRDELQGVIGHELGHVKNLDVRLMTTIAALTGAVLLVHDFVGNTMRHGRHMGGGFGRGRRSRSDGDGAGSALALVLFVVWILSWLLAPIITQLLATAVSRRREYLADAMSAQFTRNPLALAGALEKLENAREPTKTINRGAAHLCIVDPLGRRITQREGLFADVLATHPPIAKRIELLKAMGYAPSDATAPRAQA